MRRQIVIKLFGDEIVNILIDESDDDVLEETEDSAEHLGSVGSADVSISGKSSVGFGSPWSVEYWSEED